MMRILLVASAYNSMTQRVHVELAADLVWCRSGAVLNPHYALMAYRAAELAVMRRNFTAPGEPYPGLRRAFVDKDKPSHTPPHLARHRTHPPSHRPGPPRSPQTPAAPARPRQAAGDPR